MKEPKFKDYKEKQQYYKERSRTATVFYDSGKRSTRNGTRRIKGVPYVKPSERMSKWQVSKR